MSVTYAMIKEWEKEEKPPYKEPQPIQYYVKKEEVPSHIAALYREAPSVVPMEKLPPPKIVMVEKPKVEALYREAPSVAAMEKVPAYEIMDIPQVGPPPTWKETAVTGQILEGGLVGFFAEMLAPLLPKEKRRGYLESMGVVGRVVEPEYAPVIFKKPAIAGFIGVGEAWVRPEVPTPTGALVGYALGRPEQLREYEELPPEYLVGGLLGTYAEAKAIGYAVGKAWAGVKRITPKLIKEPIARAVRFGRVPKAIYRAKLAVKYREPVYTITHVPARMKTYLARQFPTAKIAVERGLAWGERQFFQPGAFEVWATTVEPYKFVGYPIIYGKAAQYAVIQVTKPTAFQQIMLGIEKGMFPRMGGLAAQQRLILRTGKRGFAPWLMPTMPVAKALARQVPTTLAGLGISAVARGIRVERPRRKRRLVTPLLVVPKPRIERLPFEREMEKFRSLVLEVPKVKERERLVPVPKVSEALLQPQLAKQEALVKTVQKQVQVLVPKIPVPTILKPPTYPYWRRRGPRETFGKRFERLLGKWYYRKHPIPTPKQLARDFMGLPRKKRRKKKAKKRS